MSEAAVSRSASERDLSFGVKLSMTLHLAVGVMILVKSLIFPGEPEVYVPSLRVDVVGLPDILKKDLAKLPPLPPMPTEAKEAPAEPPAEKTKPAKPAPAEEVAERDEMVLNAKRVADEKKKQEKTEKDRKQRMSSALARIKALNKISAEDSPQEAQVIKGNQVSAGTSLTGEAREKADSDYRDLLLDRVQRNWDLPVWLARQKYEARVVIYLDGAGRLINFRFVKASGNAQFDDEVKRALTKSAPFPPPPAAIRDSLQANGVMLGFPL